MNTPYLSQKRGIAFWHILSYIINSFSLLCLLLEPPANLIIGEVFSGSQSEVALFVGSVFEERIIGCPARAIA